MKTMFKFIMLFLVVLMIFFVWIFTGGDILNNLQQKIDVLRVVEECC